MLSDEEKDQIIATVQADNGFLREFVGDFLEDVQADVQVLADAIQQYDHVRMELLAHSMKSVVGFFKATTAYGIAKELETLGREGNIEAGARKFEELKTSLEDLQTILVETI